MKYVAFDNPDGTVSVVGPLALHARIRRKLLSEPAALDFQLARETARGALNPRILDTADGFPADRTFRDAWTGDAAGTGVAVDMPRARAIHMDRIRAARAPELARLDTEVSKALAAGDSAGAASAEAARQALRDLPATFDLTAAADPAALDALWPAILPRPAKNRGAA